MVVETTRFGQMDIDPEVVITLPQGLIGFPKAQRFCLLEHAPGLPFRWLQSLDDPSLAFVVMDPVGMFPDYEVEIPSKDARSLGIRKPEEALVLTTISIRRPPEGITANLLGPLVVGMKTKRAIQLVLDAEQYSTRHPLPVRVPSVAEPILESAA